MDNFQELFDETITKQTKATHQGKANGFIVGVTRVTYCGIIIVLLSFFLAKSDPEVSEIEDIIWPAFICFLILGLVFLFSFVANVISSSESVVNLDKIKNYGIKEIVETEYTRSHYKNLPAGIGCSVLIYTLSYYFVWHLSLDVFGYSYALFHIYRFIFIALLVYILIVLNRIDKKEGFSKEWYTEERIRPKIK